MWARARGVAGWLIAVACLLAAAAGCASRGGDAGWVAGGGAGREALQPAAEAVHAAALASLREVEGVMEVKRGGAPAELMPYAFRAEGPRRWHGTVDAYRAVDYLEGEDGAVYTTREVDFDEGVELLYDPPMLTLPATLVPGRRASGESRVVIRHLDTGAVREEGTCEYTVELIGRRAIDTPAGRFDAWVVRNFRHMDLRLADVKVTVDSAYAPGVGQVAQSIDQRVRALGLFGQHKREERRLAK